MTVDVPGFQMADEEEISDFEFDELRKKWQAARKKEFDFDEWAKEIDSHPAFMKSIPEGGDLSEAAEALQAMKYDEGDSLEVQAKAYKDDGNKNFGLKKYRWAIDCYTQGIKLKCADAKLNGILFANRAACHYRLGNYRSGLKDCVLARKFDPTHVKAVIRGIECLLKLNQPTEAMLWINELEPEKIGEQSGVRNLQDLKTEAAKMAKQKARDERKARLNVEKERKEKLSIMNALKARNVRFREKVQLDDPDQFEWSQIEVNLPGEETVARVHFDSANSNLLVWPTLFIYPEFGQTDFIREFEETETFQEHIVAMFSTPAPWDMEGTYSVDTIEIYFESRTRPDTLLKVPLDTTISTVISHPEYWIVGGLPSFMVYSSKSPKSHERLSKFSLSSI